VQTLLMQFFWKNVICNFIFLNSKINSLWQSAFNFFSILTNKNDL
jgi:hypothetical protein